MNSNIRPRFVMFVLILATVVSLCPASGAGEEPRDRFFIISSVDPAKRELLVKMPTEVTELMRVDGDTKYFDRRGKSIGLADFRAGDTVYIVTSKDGTVREIRKGPMTIQELRKRYLQASRP